jgi:hypothetical protein
MKMSVMPILASDCAFEQYFKINTFQTRPNTGDNKFSFRYSRRNLNGIDFGIDGQVL